MKSLGTIPRNRLSKIPQHLRVLHEYCFFLHDQCLHILKEYEDNKAHWVKIDLKDIDIERYKKLCKDIGEIDALNKLGFEEESKKVQINTLLMAMVSDFLHHIYEALRCFEKRKFIVGFNILRKPLLDSLIYLSWIFCRENEFYEEFSKGEPELLTQKRLGNIRKQLMEESLEKINLQKILSSSALHSSLFDKSFSSGLYPLFQHSVHLVTVQHKDLKTEPHNFNFIFKSPMSDDVYEALYAHLPELILYASHTITGLFNTMKEMDKGAYNAFRVRSIAAYTFLTGHPELQNSVLGLEKLSEHIHCEHCSSKITLTRYNVCRLLMTESFRCTKCRKDNIFPFSYIF